MENTGLICEYCIRGGAEIRNEMKSITRKLDAQKYIIKNLILRKETPALIEHKIFKFPIKTEEELIAVDQDICAQNRDLYVATMKRQIKLDVKNNFHYILSLPLLVNYNVNGIHYKKRLKSYDEFYYALLDAIEPTKEPENAEKLLKSAFIFQKRRFNHMKRSAAQQNEEQELTKSEHSSDDE